MLTGLPCKRLVNSIDGMHEFVSKYIEILIAEKVFSIDSSTRCFCLCIFNDTWKGRTFLLGHKHTFFESVFHSWGLSFGWLTLVNEHWLYFYFRLIFIYWTTLYFDFTSINFFHFVAIWEQNIFTPELDSVYTFLRDNNLRLSVCQFILCERIKADIFLSTRHSRCFKNRGDNLKMCSSYFGEQYSQVDTPLFYLNWKWKFNLVTREIYDNINYS